MAINVIVHYNGGFVPDILLLTQALVFVWFDGTIIVYHYYPFNYVLQSLPFLKKISNGRSLSWMGLTRERWCCTTG